MSYIFSNGLIKCLNCGKNYRGKMERGKRVYVCSGYSNYRLCERFQIDESELLDTITKHFIVQRRSIEEGKLVGEIKQICVQDKSYIIYYIDGTTSIVSSTHLKY